MRNITLPFFLKLACILISIVALGYLSIIGKTVLAPLVFAFLFSIFLLPIATFLEKKFHFPRGLAAIVTILVALVFFAGIVCLFGAQISNLAQEWPAFKKQILDLTHELQGWIRIKFHLNSNQQTNYINNTTPSVLNSGKAILEKTLISVSSTLLLFIFMLIYTFFILLYRRLLMRFIVVAFSQKNIDKIYDIAEQVKFIIRKYITGLFIETSIMVALSFLIFWILGIPYIFLLALLVGILNLIPYIGIYVAIAITCCITFATSDGQHALYVAIALIILHFIDANITMPKIVGSKVKLNPLIVILGVVSGGMIWGIAGMFLAIPLIGIAKVIFDRVEGFEAWGILLGDEEEKPKEMRQLESDLKKKEKNL